MSLQEAARDGKLLLVEGLLNENPKLLLSKDLDDRTALHWACSLQHTNIVQELLKPRGGKEVDIDDLVDGAGWNPLHITASVGNCEIFDLLMGNSPQPTINETTNQGTTVLHLAASKNHYDLFKKAVEDYKASTRIKDKMGYTPLIRAASTGSVRIVEFLIKKGVNLNTTDLEEWTALKHADAEGWTDVVNLLKAAGALESVN